MAEVIELDKMRKRGGELDSLEAVIHDALTETPTAKKGLVVTFDDQGGMVMYWCCNSQQMALAATRLTYLAGRGGE